MRLGAARAIPEPDLRRTVGEVLDRRLLRDTPRPIAVALSGGGDSLALLLAAADWAAAVRRPLLVLTVDHGLRPESAHWTATCATTAARLGAAFQALAWTGDKPASGLPAAARGARHALLADAAREAGARVILMGHTADDMLEAGRMRAEGSTTPTPREWSPSPAWPQGRGLFLLRPLLGTRRAEIRAWLTGRGEAWIDDPANEDMAYARARARRDLPAAAPPAAAEPASAKALAEACQADATGGLAISRAALAAADDAARLRFLSAVCLCAAGTSHPPARARVKALARRIADGEGFTASLAGARVEADESEVRFRREAGEAARGGLSPLRLAAGERAVWDGRFEVVADRETEVRAAVVDEDLPPAFRGLPSRVRRTLPTADVPLRMEALAYPRLLAACGAIAREPA
ncbi:tRNA lysidine(34) synthetase TilS [Phenylobacterium sp.]|uniref:tRNA lysidine(34) synthetase TilS n=1 Tax=Phenylobacterium sp. TaxID=1871053 RepID=UPI0025EEC724|nr:tRNA lysidine(34) synthetase TilS [Phenylobacterium sp.]